MSKFAIKGLFCSLIQTLTITPCPSNAWLSIMDKRCASGWKEIQDLKESSDNSARLEELQHKFMLLLSADYQVVQQVRKSVVSIFGSNTFTEQINRPCFCSMINNSKQIIGGHLQ